MKKTFFYIIGLILLCNVALALEVNHLRTEYLQNPIGVDFDSPRFSWHLKSEEMDVAQSAYEITISVEGKDVFGTGKVLSNQNYLVETSFKTEPKTRYTWTVFVWDNKGNKTQSNFAYFETGLKGNWKGKWIGIDDDSEPRDKKPVQYYRLDFNAKSAVKSARIYCSAYGMYDLHLNGNKVGTRELSPGWTSYEHQLEYQTYKLDSIINVGTNCLSVRLAQGWLQGRIALKAKAQDWQKDLSFLLELHIEYVNGKTDVITSNKNWKTAKGGFLEADIYDGEIFDYSLEPENWQNVGFDDATWLDVALIDKGFDNLVSENAPSISVIKELAPVKREDVSHKLTIYDFGENLAGRVQITLDIKEPCEVFIEHAEVLDENRQFYTDNLRGAQAKVLLRFNKAGKYKYTPSFSFMGFRYARVSGVTRYQIKRIRHQVLSSNLENTGAFECSHNSINQLYTNINNSQISNFIDVPIDCPQRDERQGWTGDAQAFATTAAYNSQVAPFFKEWLTDLASDQYKDGAVPWIVPDVFKFARKPSAGWADAATILPWAMYNRYGDIKFLEDQYASMKAWVDYMVTNANEGLWFGDMHFGDWMNVLSPTKPNSMKRTYETDYIAQVFFQHSLNIMAKTAMVLNNTNDYKIYSDLFETANTAFLNEFVTPSGRIGMANQTAYVLALQFNLLPEDYQAQAIIKLKESVVQYGHLTTGFIGTPHLNPTLSKVGLSHLAYDLLLNDEFPSWLYPVNLGATSIWERWDGVKPRGGLQDPYVNSFNHYAYGAIGFWLYANMGGINIEMVNGKQQIILAPEVDERLTFAKAKYKSVFGDIESHWRLAEEDLTYEFVIPANAQAKVVFPKGYLFVSLTAISKGEEVPIKFFKAPLELSLGSGSYVLELIKASEN